MLHLQEHASRVSEDQEQQRAGDERCWGGAAGPKGEESAGRREGCAQQEDRDPVVRSRDDDGRGSGERRSGERMSPADARSAQPRQPGRPQDDEREHDEGTVVRRGKTGESERRRDQPHQVRQRGRRTGDHERRDGEQS
jgi:hypothetical protein